MLTSEIVINDLFDKIIDAERGSVANFTSYKGRNKSFCVDFTELTKADEYNLANYAHDQRYQYDGYSPEQYTALITVGEYLILGSYILAKRSQDDLIPEYRALVVRRLLAELEWSVKAKALLSDSKKIQYFDDCINEAVRLAKK